MEKAILLSADVWEMQDEKTGQIRKGVSVWYITEYRDPSEVNSTGYKPAKVTADFSLWQKLHNQLPCRASMHYASRPGPAGKATLVLVDIDVDEQLFLFAKDKK
jgi:hypothetical protein